MVVQDSGAFVVRLGNDTLALEQYKRTATQLRGEYVIRTPRSLHRIYTFDLNPDGTVRRLELVTHNIGGGPGPMETRNSGDLSIPAARVRLTRANRPLGACTRERQRTVYRAHFEHRDEWRLHRQARRRYPRTHVRPRAIHRSRSIHVPPRPPGSPHVAHGKGQHAAGGRAARPVRSDGPGRSDVREPAARPVVASRHGARDHWRLRGLDRLQPPRPTRPRHLRRPGAVE